MTWALRTRTLPSCGYPQKICFLMLSTREMALSAKCSVPRQGDLASDPQHPHESQAHQRTPAIPALRGGDRGMDGTPGSVRDPSKAWLWALVVTGWSI